MEEKCFACSSKKNGQSWQHWILYINEGDTAAGLILCFCCFIVNRVVRPLKNKVVKLPSPSSSPLRRHYVWRISVELVEQVSTRLFLQLTSIFDGLHNCICSIILFVRRDGGKEMSNKIEVDRFSLSKTKVESFKFKLVVLLAHSNPIKPMEQGFTHQPVKVKIKLQWNSHQFSYITARTVPQMAPQCVLSK